MHTGPRTAEASLAWSFRLVRDPHACQTLGICLGLTTLLRPRPLCPAEDTGFGDSGFPCERWRTFNGPHFADEETGLAHIALLMRGLCSAMSLGTFLCSFPQRRRPRGPVTLSSQGHRPSPGDASAQRRGPLGLILEDPGDRALAMSSNEEPPGPGAQQR